jgi:hypothetical protein
LEEARPGWRGSVDFEPENPCDFNFSDDCVAFNQLLLSLKPDICRVSTLYCIIDDPH